MASLAAKIRASRWDLLAIALPAVAAFAYAVISPWVLHDGDTNMHIASGRWMLEHARVPTTDPFSYTAVGHRWVTHEWLSEVFLALAYLGGGWSGVRLLTAVAAAATLGLMANALRRWMSPLSAFAALVFSLATLAVHILGRPHILALPVLAFWLIQLLDARRRDRTPSLWMLPLMLFWANLHGSYIFGLAFTCAFALEAFIDAKGRRWAVATRWGAFLVALTVVAAITPNGILGLVHPAQVMAMKDLQSIGEWKAVNFEHATPFEMGLLLVLFVCLYLGVKVPPVRLALLTLLLYMTLQHIRQEVVLAVAAPLLLAEPLGRAMRGEGGATQVPPEADFSGLAAPMAVLAALFLALGVWRMATPERRVDQSTLPLTALEHVPPALQAMPVFNNYSFGGWLMLKGVRPFIDGRADMYGNAFFKLYLDAESGDPAAIAQVLRTYHVAWTILTPTSPMVARLDGTPGWRRLYADKWAVVQVRDPAAPAATATAAKCS